ncbi:MAG: N-acetyltransferase [Planctomycetota bacterium]|mgnify:CR=1 FL=1
MAEIRYRPARLADVPAMGAIITGFADQKLMLQRSQSELYENVRDFLVAEAEVGGICGCVALHIDTDRIAEVKALAVASSAQGLGIGRGLVLAAIDTARELGLERVFCLTYQADFFAKLGFTKVDRARLPDKVWGECVRCHRFLDCDEVAMWRLVDVPTAAPN